MERKKIPLTPEQRKLSYSKYYDLELTKPSEEVLKAYHTGPMDPKYALRIEDRTKLFDPGYHEVETGFCNLEDGSGYIACLTNIPGVTPEMFDWFFAWLGLGDDLRYRIWNPYEHYSIRTLNVAQGLCPKLSYAERLWGTTHLMTEDTGFAVMDLCANFKAPSEMGFDHSKIGTDACASIVTANSGSVKHPGLRLVMVHFLREIPEGVELRTRFWMGYQLINNKPVNMLPEGGKIPAEALSGSILHINSEFGHMAAFLPQLYEEEKDNWLDKGI